MFNFKKKDSGMPQEDIEDVKRRVLGETTFDDPLESLIPDRMVRSSQPSQPPQPPQRAQPQYEEEQEDVQHDEMVPYAPVFVKLEKYGDLLTELSKTESLIEHLKDAIAARDKIDQLHSAVIGEIRETTALLESHLDTIDRKFRKPEAPKVDIIKPKQKVGQLDKIHEELENLKKELKDLK